MPQSLGYLFRITSMVDAKSCQWLILFGSFMIFLAGVLTATWKLLSTLGWGDMLWKSDIQFLLMVTGYLMVFMAMIFLAFHHRSKSDSLPGWLMADWKISFVDVMSLSSQGPNSQIHFRTYYG